jgi:hypothetical protein
MQLEDARRKRIEANMVRNGWKMEHGQPQVNAVRIWLYSINPLTGVRVAAQLSAELYRDMLSGAGAFQRLQLSGVPPNELLRQAIEDFDAAPQADLAARQGLMMVMANFAIRTQTWARLDPLSEVDGIHFVISDWMTNGGAFILRPIAMYSDQPLTPDEMAECVATLLDMHLARAPDQAPKGF